MTPQERKERKRRTIVEAAAKVFAARGYNKTLMAEIATEAGVGKGTVYEYFSSKSELFLAVFHWFVDRLTASATVQFQSLGGSASQRLVALVDSVTSAVDDMNDFCNLTLEFWAATSSWELRDKLKEAITQTYSGYRQAIRVLMEEGKANGEFRPDLDLDSAAAGLLAAMDGLFLQSWFDSQIKALPTTKSFLDILLKGMINPGGGGET
ncbi:MAG: TetR/AcrR family transcriptional regulator [Desulfarculaceae bacterium]|jgi:AcrR family transcriptional regulator